MDRNMCLVTGYKKYHGIISSLICMTGLFGNTFSLVIWTKRRQKSPINLVLLCLSAADFCTVFFYFIYVVYLHLATEPTECGQHTKAGMDLVHVCFHAYIVASTWSSWCTISLAIFRYISVCKSGKAKIYCTKDRVLIVMVLVFILVQLSSIPFYLYYKVEDLSSINGSNLTGYWLAKTEFADTYFKSYQTVLLWLYGVIMKLIPCALLCTLSGLIIRKLLAVQQRTISSSRHRKRYNRTTVMLVTIVLVYVATALPIGIAAFISGVKLPDDIHFFYFLTYSDLGNFFNLFPITNASVNFFVYMIMSEQYRRAFVGLFRVGEEEVDSTSRGDSTENHLSTEEHEF